MQGSLLGLQNIKKKQLLFLKNIATDLGLIAIFSYLYCYSNYVIVLSSSSSFCFKAAWILMSYTSQNFPISPLP